MARSVGKDGKVETHWNLDSDNDNDLKLSKICDFPIDVTMMTSNFPKDLKICDFPIDDFKLSRYIYWNAHFYGENFYG